MNSFIMTKTGITIFFESSGEPHTISDSHENFAAICQCVHEDDFDEALKLTSPKAALEAFTYESDRFKIQDGQVYFDEHVIHNYACSRMIEMAHDGLDLTYIENFLINLYDNPSFKSIKQLYEFLEKSDLPLTPDGHFLAYKRINFDWTDCYTSTIDNSVGKVVQMKRSEVNDDSEETCSDGLHFCSHSYLRHFHSGRTVVVKINPRDVVSIPVDYNNAKGRCCEYEVIRELEGYGAENMDGIEGLVSDDHVASYEMEDYFVDDEEQCEHCGDDVDDCFCDGEHMYDGEEENEDDSVSDLIISIEVSTNQTQTHENITQAAIETGVRERYINYVLDGVWPVASKYKFKRAE